MRKRLSKIVATVGPASASSKNLEMLSDVGVDVFRLNFSHGEHEKHAEVVKNLRAIEKKHGRPIAIVADMQGPKIRVATFSGGGMDIEYGQELEVRIGDEEGGNGVIYMPHPELLPAIKAGHTLKFDDGKLSAEVLENTGDGLRIKVGVPGRLKDRKGVNLIGPVLPISAMTDKDKIDMAFALDQGVDYIALSFVQSAQDVHDAKAIIKGRAGLISKMEKPSAIDELVEIVEASDAVMVARGDLGVELPLEQVPVVQRRIIREARARGKPAIVATHMLESMIDSPTPTRAEASDVATAIYQGADAVMLSAETAVGRHPGTAVAIMDRILKAVEEDPVFWDFFSQNIPAARPTSEDAVAQAARKMAGILDIKAILAYTSTGSTAKRVARERPPCPVLGLTPHARTASQLALCWGVTPVIVKDPRGFADMLVKVQDTAKSVLGAETGDKVLVAAGIPFGRPGATDTLKIAEVE